ncbi:hypothetical protein, partial [Thermocatellispora tengchongensis]|uniref:hypothetical protein n=1 Tax=Thermocatellispora tengchongensis TaxID=1073253 RepID=UPI0031E4FE9F
MRLVVEKPGPATGLPRLSSNEGNYLFSIESLQAAPITGKYLTLLLLVAGIAAYVLGWVLLARQRFAQGRVWQGALLVLVPLLLFRAVLLYLGLPFSLLEIGLFDPRVYAASLLSPSLGDLLLNALLLLVMAWYALLLFRRYKLRRFALNVHGSGRQRRPDLLLAMGRRVS